MLGFRFPTRSDSGAEHVATKTSSTSQDEAIKILATRGPGAFRKLHAAEGPLISFGSHPKLVAAEPEPNK